MESGDPGSAWQVQMGRHVGALPAVAAPVDDPRVCALLAQLASAVEGIAELDASTLTSEDRLALVCGAENTRRLLTGASHTWLNGLVAGSGFDSVLGAIGASGVPHALAHMLRITTAAAASRLAVARDLGTGTTMTGEALDPPLPHTASAARDGALAEAHVSIIRSFLKKLPHAVDAETRDSAEQTLADLARTVGPEELTAIATRLTEYLDPDGAEPDDRDRARKRFFELDPQGPDSMTTGRFCADPELRAVLEALFAKFAAPGTLTPEGAPAAVDLDAPAPTDARDQEAEWDHRTPGQRNHDALTYLLKDSLSSGRHGQHRGVPLSVIVSVSLEQLTAAAGLGLTATGSTIPVAEVVRRAAEAHHYLRVFDGASGSTLHFARARRCASTDQRLALFARDRGCTGPGCTAPASRCEAHHVDDWAAGGLTDIDDLALACDVHHPLVGERTGQWATSIAPPGHPYPGTVLWHPPAVIDEGRHGIPNHLNFPERHLAPPPDD
ncbi:DUF222 domain-containing protein [Rhodococcus sp. BP-349]|uniref:HNH endonuclease signature motif containing protein n=1 Tax=unclassified Rhodococcus (in: high G+C Gram-positive bacteria) TaxID=192944 RepID=UPI001C9B9D3D|nr:MULTISPECIES: HNH endonuclease signature motif containing protein [unclassified Rhodococcus (in: high G+C Gram-positive bacteria)]MBY6538335.1 DUF222 domain-containing protein [Rhodococcus sp. BP-363]MBY6542672.1 DUF222 domain-containing protein [Rhodococcus sp. BP-369]MBY6561902.1 DUF222 domain-containing protein [Rhodococcus sp. BP-370]MBY6576194.1 DUF222 domain-containing protein [Rhodococcus sp. BP-364]MBY6585495.1 DUF222 domain-containing protein [Rhodococcus sp. BP-358]